jgi:hypothetical protein
MPSTDVRPLESQTRGDATHIRLPDRPNLLFNCAHPGLLALPATKLSVQRTTGSG